MGTLITLDDDLPGGWDNPDGSRRPEWLTAPYWAQIFTGLSVASFVSAIDEDSRSSLVTFTLAGLVFLVVAVLLGRRRV